MTFNRNSEDIALQTRKMVAEVVAKLGIQSERPRVKASLNQPDTGEILFSRALMHRVHQTPANGAILHSRINRDWTNASNRVAFVQKIAADNPTVDFRNDRVKLRISQHRR